ncbi:MAG: Rieske 2Fe-2S domain-containing protein, partial [Rhodospirillaceae bacterium]|nr:Rieske 2Fe-2S domain-containing protein [Rhodospirillaceae bacterium]
MSDAAWETLKGLDPATATFPAPARIAGVPVFVFRTGAGFRAVARACPHQRASLVDAKLIGDGKMLRCSAHAFTFSLKDGKGV